MANPNPKSNMLLIEGGKKPGITEQFKEDVMLAVTQVCNLHGISLSSIKQVDRNKESIFWFRTSEIDINGQDTLKRDLLEFCELYGYKASICNAEFEVQGVLSAITGIDTIQEPIKFRVSNVNNETYFLSFDNVKAILPELFTK